MKPTCETVSFHKSCRPAVATLYLIRSPVYITVEHTLATNLIKVNSIEGVQSSYRTMQFRKMSLDSDCKEA